MSLADLFTPRRRKPDPIELLFSQLGDLRRQTQHISRAVSHRAGETTDEWSDVVADLGREAARQGAWLAGSASRQVVKGAQAVQRDPLPVIAVLGTALLVTSLLSRRR